MGSKPAGALLNFMLGPIASSTAWTKVPEEPTGFLPGTQQVYAKLPRGQQLAWEAGFRDSPGNRDTRRAGLPVLLALLGDREAGQHLLGHQRKPVKNQCNSPFPQLLCSFSLQGEATVLPRPFFCPCAPASLHHHVQAWGVGAWLPPCLPVGRPVSGRRDAYSHLERLLSLLEHYSPRAPPCDQPCCHFPETRALQGQHSLSPPPSLVPWV